MMPVATVSVDVPDAPYGVVIGPGLLGSAGERLRSVTRAARVALITDENVEDRFAPTVAASLADAGFQVSSIVIPAGEESKSWARAGETLESLARANLGRADLVVALGGGVVGDLAGFCAATYLRGVDYAQLPTTLLAQVDSSVGGKTGVDLDAGKNLAGAFKQPVLVLADTRALSSLPEIEWASGLAEVAKVAILESEERLARTEACAPSLVGREDAAVQEAVRSAVAFKARVVIADERESGLRECLNYGHTFGHALENVLGYGSVPHGIAVAEGVRFAARLAVDTVGADPEFAARQERLLDDLGIPRVRARMDPAALRAVMSSDKKARGGRPRFVLLAAPGRISVESVDEDLLAAHVRRFTEELGERG